MVQYVNLNPQEKVESGVEVLVSMTDISSIQLFLNLILEEENWKMNLKMMWCTAQIRPHQAALVN